MRSAGSTRGVSPTEAFRRQGRRGKKLSRATISRERAKWLAETTAAAVAFAVAKLPTAESSSSLAADPQQDLFSHASATSTAVSTNETTIHLGAAKVNSNVSDKQQDDVSDGVNGVTVDEVAVADEALTGETAIDGAIVDASAGEQASDETGDGDSGAASMTAAPDEAMPVLPQRSRPIKRHAIFNTPGPGS